MRQRRTKRKFKNNNLDNLQIISKILMVLIVICLIIFIYSSIQVKNSTLISKSNHSSKIAETNTIDENIASINNGLNI